MLVESRQLSQPVLPRSPSSLLPEEGVRVSPPPTPHKSFALICTQHRANCSLLLFSAHWSTNGKSVQSISTQTGSVSLTKSTPRSGRPTACSSAAKTSPTPIRITVSLWKTSVRDKHSLMLCFVWSCDRFLLVYVRSHRKRLVILSHV